MAVSHKELELAVQDVVLAAEESRLSDYQLMHIFMEAIASARQRRGYAGRTALGGTRKIEIGAGSLTVSSNDVPRRDGLMDALGITEEPEPYGERREEFCLSSGGRGLRWRDEVRKQLISRNHIEFLLGVWPGYVDALEDVLESYM